MSGDAEQLEECEHKRYDAKCIWCVIRDVAGIIPTSAKKGSDGTWQIVYSDGGIQSYRPRGEMWEPMYLMRNYE